MNSNLAVFPTPPHNCQSDTGRTLDALGLPIQSFSPLDLLSCHQFSCAVDLSLPLGKLIYGDKGLLHVIIHSAGLPRH